MKENWANIKVNAVNRLSRKAAAFHSLPVFERLYEAGIIIMCIKVMLSCSGALPSGRVVDEILSVIASVCMLASTFVRRHETRTLICFGLLILLAGVTCICVGSMMIMMTVLTCIAVCGMKLEKTLRLIFRTELLFLIINPILALIRMPFGYEILTKASGKMCCNFGFSHPNTFSVVLFNVICIWLWLNYDRVSKRNVIWIAFINLFTYAFTECRTQLICVIALSVLFFVFYHQQKLEKILSILTACATPVVSMLVFFFISTFASGNKLSHIMDLLFSSRIRLGAYGYENFGATLFGRNLNGITYVYDSFWQLSAETLIFDNFYSFFIVNYGVIWLLLAGCLIACIARKRITRNNIFLSVWVLYGVTEIHTLNPFMLFPLLLVSVLYRDNPYVDWIYEKIKSKCGGFEYPKKLARFVRKTADRVSIYLDAAMNWLEDKAFEPAYVWLSSKLETFTEGSDESAES